MFLVLKMIYNLTWSTTNMTAHYTNNLGSANGKRVLISVDKLQNYQHESDFAIISWLYLLLSDTLVYWSFIILLSKIRNVHK